MFLFLIPEQNYRWAYLLNCSPMMLLWRTYFGHLFHVNHLLCVAKSSTTVFLRPCDCQPSSLCRHTTEFRRRSLLATSPSFCFLCAPELLCKCGFDECLDFRSEIFLVFSEFEIHFATPPAVVNALNLGSGTTFECLSLFQSLQYVRLLNHNSLLIFARPYFATQRHDLQNILGSRYLRIANLVVQNNRS